MKQSKYAHACEELACEGSVLLKNDGMLPLKKEDKVAIFGREQFEYVKSGSGSGGLVNCPYVSQITDSLKGKVQIEEETEAFFQDYIQKNPYDIGNDWFHPSVQKQPMIDESFVKKVSQKASKAIVVISRLFGEDKDMSMVKGEYLLTDEEKKEISLVRKYFKEVALLINSGNILDFSWIEKQKLNAILLLWNGGQEGGRAAADMLVGERYPSGKLPVTIASIDGYQKVPYGSLRNIHHEDIYVGYRYFLTFDPKKIYYPFGYGLTYTEFLFQDISCIEKNKNIHVSLTVKNMGKRSGKEVVQIYFSAPQGKLGKAKRELIAFKKTKELLPQEEERIEIIFPISRMKALDEEGLCGLGEGFVLEKGTYSFYLGKNSLEVKKIGSYQVKKDTLVEHVEPALFPEHSFTCLTPQGEKEIHLKQRIERKIETKEIPYTGERNISLKDVYFKKHTLDEFIAQFKAEELFPLLIGEGWGSKKASVAGAAAVLGGTTPAMKEHGVKVITATDGPSGPRTLEEKKYTCIPVGILLASTFNPSGLKKVFTSFAEELLSSNIDIILAPGMNIMRHPFGGRNFEYLSEDPYLAGTIASAIVKDFAKEGIQATVKHFACNSQEVNRFGEDEVLSERALREIYLRPFEMVVKTGELSCLMTSYNRINGTSNCSNIELIHEILRKDWHYQGLVMTDWFAKSDKEDGTYSDRNIAEVIKADGDIYMVKEDAIHNDNDLEEEYQKGSLSLGQIQTSAKRVLTRVLNSASFKKEVEEK